MPADYDAFILISHPRSTNLDNPREFRFRAQFFEKLPSDLLSTSQVIERTSYMERTFDRELPPTALSKITAEDMPLVKIDWDGEPLIEEEHSLKHHFSMTSMIIIAIILAVILVFTLKVSGNRIKK